MRDRKMHHALLSNEKKSHTPWLLWQMMIKGCFIICVLLFVCCRATAYAVEQQKAPEGEKSVVAELATKVQYEKELRRQEAEIIADKHIKRANEFYKDKNYESALIEYKAALQLTPWNKKLEKDITQCENKIEKMQPKVVNKETKIKQKGEKKQKKGRVLLPKDRPASPHAPFNEAGELYRQGIMLYNESRYEEAMDMFNRVLQLNPHHIPARRYIKEIMLLIRSDLKKDEAILSDERMADIQQAWVSSRKKPDQLGATRPEGAMSRVKTEQQLLMEKKAKQIIPEINFTDAHLRDVIRYLSKISGVNIILDEDIFKNSGGADIPQFVGLEEETTGGTGGDGQAAAKPQPVEIQQGGRITITLTNIPLIEALRYVLQTKGLSYRIDEYAILVSTPERLVDVEMETRYYHLSRGVGSFTEFIADTDLKKPKRGDRQYMDSSLLEPKERITIKDVLEQSGVPFPAGSKVFLDQRTGTLIVRNTPKNLSLIEDILKTLDVTPFQVSIESRFMEIKEGSLEEIGVEWLLEDDWEMWTNQRKGMPIGASERLVARGNTWRKVPPTGSNLAAQNVGFSKGLRPFVEEGGTETPSSLFAISSILTNPEFSVLVHALNQSDKVKLLSSPKVTTVNNQLAQISVVKEIRYPTEFELVPPTVSSSGNAIITPGLAVPGTFDRRDVGIILNVTPSVGADRKTIHLTLLPEVSQFVGWQDFGASLGDQIIPILQPIFASQNVSTSVIVNDGETVVLGGLMEDYAQVRKDKVPLLGSVPILGRLFRHDVDQANKRNLIIFVTAMLLTPSGETLCKKDLAQGELVA